MTISSLSLKYLHFQKQIRSFLVVVLKQTITFPSWAQSFPKRQQTPCQHAAEPDLGSPRAPSPLKLKYTRGLQEGEGEMNSDKNTHF